MPIHTNTHMLNLKLSPRIHEHPVYGSFHDTFFLASAFIRGSNRTLVFPQTMF